VIGHKGPGFQDITGRPWISLNFSLTNISAGN
jgi:hypothetical protein